MKKFLIKISLLFIIMVVCDQCFGFFMQKMLNSIQIGGQGRDNYICNKAEEDFLIFGSSRAVHHYNSQMLEDSLNISCYNCGDDGNGIILSYGRLKMIKERHQPKVVIQDVSYQFDLFENDNHTYLGWLKPRYNRIGISEIFDDIDKSERYKMYSQMYRYNSKFFQNILVFATSVSSDVGIKGFRPVKAKFNPMKASKKQMMTEDVKYDSLKLAYLNKFIDLAGDAEVFFVVSPMWRGADSTIVEPVREICRNRNIHFLDFSNNPKYVHNNDFFGDGTHLNSTGADEFTKDIIKEIKKQKEKL